MPALPASRVHGVAITERRRHEAELRERDSDEEATGGILDAVMSSDDDVDLFVP